VSISEDVIMKNLCKFVLVLAVALGFASVSGCNNQSSGDDGQGAVAVQTVDDASAPADAAVLPPPPPATSGDPSMSDAINDNQDFA